MTTPNPFRYTEDFLRAYVSELVGILKFPLCPNVMLDTLRELNASFEALRELEEAKEHAELVVQ